LIGKYNSACEHWNEGSGAGTARNFPGYVKLNETNQWQRIIDAYLKFAVCSSPLLRAKTRSEEAQSAVHEVLTILADMRL
jgi:hypothetical protein